MTTMMDMGRFRGRLPVVMAEHRIKQAQLSEAAGLREATLHALYHDANKRIDFSTLIKVIEGLRSLTGQTYTLNDLFEYVPDDAQLN